MPYTEPSWRDALEREARRYLEMRAKRFLELHDLTHPSTSWGGGKGTNLDDRSTREAGDKANGMFRAAIAPNGPVNFFVPDPERCGNGFNKGRDVIMEWVDSDGVTRRKSCAVGTCVSAIKNGFPR